MKSHGFRSIDARATVPATFRARACALALAAAALGVRAAPAETPPPPREQLDLTSSATLEVAQDWVAITLGTTREGSDASVVQTQLKQALDAALIEARRSAKPGMVEVRTGNFALGPRYAPKGGVNGWQGSAELVVEGRDLATLGQLAGRIGTLTVARVAYSLSRELRERSESQIAAEAIARYRAKAAEYARQFGYAGYTLGEVSVSSVDGTPPPPRPMMRTMAMAAAPSDDALPIEPGKGSLTVTVSGNVRLVR